MSPVAVGYVRVSTVEQAGSGLGMEAQREAIRAACRARRLTLVAIHEDAGVSSVARERPGLEAALHLCETRGPAGDVRVLVVAKLDRLARSLSGYVRLLERAQRHGWQLLALDAPDGTTPQGEALQAMSAVFAQLERRLVGQRTKEALAAARVRGVILGRPVTIDTESAQQMVKLRRRGFTLRAISRQVADGTWGKDAVARILRSRGVKPGRRRSRKIPA